MKKSVLLLSLIASTSVFAAETVPYTPKAGVVRNVATQDYHSQAAKNCIADTVAMKAVLSGAKYDAVLTSHFNAFPEFQEQVAMEMANPYRCSLK